MGDEAELVLDLRADLAEAPLWHATRRTLCFVDIVGRRFYEYDPSGNAAPRCRLAPESIGCIVPREGGGFLAALNSGLWSLGEDQDDFTPFSTPAGHDSTRCRFNDGKCDPQGRLWAGTMSLTDEAEAGALYCFPPGKAPRQVLARVSVSNGLAWSRDSRTFYYIDSRTRRLDAFAFEPETGALSGRRTVIDFSATGHVPDGCTIDAEGMLWVAQWRGACVTRWNPSTGQALARVAVPAPHVTSCTFGGPDYRILYITTARRGLTPEQLAAFPHSGGIFACEPGVNGLPPDVYRG